MNIFVAKLSASTSSDDLHTLFGDYGEVVSAKVIFDRDTGESKCYGFVEMANDDEASKAIDELNDSEFASSTIVVKKSQPKPDYKKKSNFGGGGRRNQY
jgi:RNA recognition motif-containing protein